MASPSYRERMKAARAAASAARKAQQAEWHRRLELSCEVRRLALNRDQSRHTSKRRQAPARLKGPAREADTANEMISGFVRRPGEGRDRRANWSLSVQTANTSAQTVAGFSMTTPPARSIGGAVMRPVRANTAYRVREHLT